MKLTDKFERVVVINLPFKGDRKQKLKKNLEKTGIADLKAVEWERAIYGEWAPAPAWWGAGNGGWGCFMSHLRVAQNAAHDKVDSYCVLEDDVVFHEQASTVLGHFADELPKDWGQVYLGGQYLNREPEVVSPWVLRPFNVNRTHAFALHKDTYAPFLEHITDFPFFMNPERNGRGMPILSPRDFHIDHRLGDAHEKRLWNTYSPVWWIAGQAEGVSEINKGVNEQNWWHLGTTTRGKSLPFFFIKNATQGTKLFSKMIHTGNTLKEGTFTDMGITTKLSDGELLHWLKMIASEAVEKWKLPGFQVPEDQPGFVERVSKLWEADVYPYGPQKVKEFSNYPYNGYAGGVASPITF